MKRRTNCLTLLAAMLFLSPSLMAQVDGDYRSLSTGDWSNATRWERFDGVSWLPATVVPTALNAQTITIRSGHNVTVGLAPQMGDQVVVAAGGTLTINTSLTIEDGAGTDLSVLGNLVLNGGTLASGSGSPVSTITSTMDWSSGNLSTPLIIASGAVLTINVGTKNLNSTLTNNGTVNVLTTLINFNNGVVENNSSVIATAATGFNFGSGTNSFNNNPGGTFSKQSNTGNLTFNIPLVNAGTVDIASGAILVSSANSRFINSGNVNFSGGNGITLSGTLTGNNQFNSGSTVTGTGTVTIAAATDVNLALTLPATVNLSLTHVNTTSLAGSGSLGISGAATWTTGILAVPTTINSGGSIAIAGNNAKTLSTTLSNNGSINWTSNNLSFAGGVVNNNSSFIATGDNAFQHTSGLNSFNNNPSGTFTKNTGTGTTTFSIPVHNEGAFTITSGTTLVSTVNGAFTNTGSINLNNTALTLSGSNASGNSFGAGTSLTGAGTITATTSNAVNLPLIVPAGITLAYGGNLQTLGGSGSIAINGDFQLGQGVLTVPVTINAAGAMSLVTGTRTLSTTLTNNGTTDWIAGDVSFSNGSVLNTGTLTLSGTGNFTTVAATTNAFNNSGSLIKTSPGITSIGNLEITSSGLIRIDAGTVTKAGTSTSFTNTGTINIASGAIFNHSTVGVTAALILDAGTTFAGAGLFRINGTTNVNTPVTFPASLAIEMGTAGSTLTVSGAGPLLLQGAMTWGLGTLNTPLTIAGGATLTSVAAKTIGTTVTNNGTINLTDPAAANNIALTNGSIVNNGLINDNNNGNNRQFSNSGGTNTFVNNGTYHKSSNEFLSTFANGVSVTNNSGAVFSGIGEIVFAGAITNNGILQPGDFAGAAGILQTSVNAITAKATNIRVKILNSTVPGVGHDQLNVPAATNISTDTLTVIDNVTAPFPAQYTVMTSPLVNGFVGTFALVRMPANYTIAYNYTTNPSTIVVSKIGATLPVTWGAFTAQERNSRVDLRFSTLTEENTSHFLVQHSTDGVSYHVVGKLPAQGNSGTEVFYSYTHNSPDLAAVNYYRIEQVDIDGNSKYSSVRPVRFNNGRVVAVMVTPNPVRGSMQLNIQQSDLRIQLSSANGAVVRNWNFQKGVHSVSVDNLPAGIYQLSVFDKTGRIETQQIVKQ
ncbi:MAG: T9SS type A sorting domain-containing protein [Chitinophagaceae bacterium]|nr:MAG: T9SS type A sorting domain-containing protein [Chitinophagaceae bacterium]